MGKKPAKFALEGSKWAIVCVLISIAIESHRLLSIVGVPRKRGGINCGQGRNQPGREPVRLQELDYNYKG